MEEQDRDRRTEEATPRRKEKLRAEGKVAKSPDVGATAILLGCAAVLGLTGRHAAVRFADASTRYLAFEDVGRPLRALEAALPVLVLAVGPCLAVAALLAVAAGMAQTRGLFSLALVAIKPERLNPIPQIANVLPTPKSLGEMAKQLAKIVLLGLVVYHVVADASTEFAVLPASEPTVAAATVGRVATDVALYGGAAFAAIAAADYWLAWRRFRRESMMSRRDLREEHKEQEGRPEVKQRQRQRMREAGRRRAVGGVKDATVLVTNPTHYACALRYDPDRDAAPVLLAKGTDELALSMRSEARAHGVPIVENRPLARALYADATVGKTIPVDLYRSAAEVIVHVMRLGGGVG